MPKAAKSHTTPVLESVPDPTEDALALFRRIADQSADSLLLADGPPHPDARLFDLAADVFEAKKKEVEASNFANDTWKMEVGKIGSAAHIHMKANMIVVKGYRYRISRLAKAAAKIEAKTPAGLYAKVQIVRQLVTPLGIVKSLIDDILGNPDIRAALWPSNPE
jgi:hypothetical protein